MSRHPLTRREFLATGLAVVSTAGTMPTFLQHSALALTDPDSAVKNRPGVPEDRILVVVQLSGGNDGLNTLVPYGADAYYRARPVIAIPRDSVIPLDRGNGVGLHPNLTALKEMIDDGLAAIVQGVGYPNPNRSHFASMDIWHTGDTLQGGSGGRGVGWIGQAMDQLAVQPDGRVDQLACVCTGHEAPLAAQGRYAKPIAFNNANLFRWVGADLHPVLAEEYDRINRAGVLGTDIEPGSNAAFVQRTALDAQVASQRIRNAVGRGTLTSFRGGQLANQLRMVASMIRAELPTRVYYVALGGFDTHANQPGRHAQLMSQFANGVKAFYDELQAMGQAQRVLTLAFSEFGRRVSQNASNGTDHGTAGPTFLLGPMVRPGLLGHYPSLQRLEQDDLVYTVDFRNLYATVLDHWLKADSTAILGRRFQPANVLRT